MTDDWHTERLRAVRDTKDMVRAEMLAKLPAPTADSQDDALVQALREAIKADLQDELDSGSTRTGFVQGLRHALDLADQYLLPSADK